MTKDKRNSPPLLDMVQFPMKSYHWKQTVLSAGQFANFQEDFQNVATQGKMAYSNVQHANSSCRIDFLILGIAEQQIEAKLTARYTDIRFLLPFIGTISSGLLNTRS